MSDLDPVTCPRLECHAALLVEASGPWLCPRCGLPFYISEFEDISEFEEEAIPIELGVYLANMTGTVPTAEEAEMSEPRRTPLDGVRWRQAWGGRVLHLFLRGQDATLCGAKLIPHIDKLWIHTLADRKCPKCLKKLAGSKGSDV